MGPELLRLWWEVGGQISVVMMIAAIIPLKVVNARTFARASVTSALFGRNAGTRVAIILTHISDS